MSDVKIIQRDPARDAQFVAEVTAKVQGGDIAGAMALARHGLDNGVIHPLLLNLRAAWHAGAGRDGDALDDLRIAFALDANDVFVRNALGVALGRMGKWDEALPVLKQGVALAPDFVPAQFALGWAYEFTGELKLAGYHFKQAAGLDANFAPAWAHLASLAYRRSDWKACEDYAAKALAADPHQPVALTALTGAALARRDPEGAEGLLARLGDFARLPETEAALAETMLGDLRDAQKRTDDAFAAYQRRNRAKFAAAKAQFDIPGRTATDYVTWLADYYAQAQGLAPPPTEPDPRDGAMGHVFLVGFPRSGTTLLENVLASHAQICALDERDTLGEAARAYLTDEAGRKRLEAITPEEIAQQRAIYWQRVKTFGADVKGKTFVDKYPLSTIKLPLVAKLFPEAKILFALRDPRDVVWSCYRRIFALNTSMFELLDLERGARFYDAVMKLAAIYRARLNLAWHDVRYESLVADFDGETRAISAFLGLDFDERMRDFAELSKARTIKTPSSTQVVRGLYKGSGQWEPYAEHLAPALAILAPWVEKFGYADVLANGPG
jgi:tetratricopeptide (TPR) repeat protein